MDIKLILNIFLYLVISLINLLIWDLYMIRILIEEKENLSNHSELNKKIR